MCWVLRLAHHTTLCGTFAAWSLEFWWGPETDRERERSTQGGRVLFSSVGLWEGLLGVKISRSPYLCVSGVAAWIAAHAAAAAAAEEAAAAATTATWLICERDARLLYALTLAHHIAVAAPLPHGMRRDLNNMQQQHFTLFLAYVHPHLFTHHSC